MLVIFDVDGTLIDSQNLIVEALRRCFEAHDMPPPSREKSLSIVGLSLPEAFVQLAGMDAPIESLAAHYKSQFFSLRGCDEWMETQFGGADALLRTLYQRGVTLGLATGKSRRGVRHLLETTGWEPLMSTTQTADEHPSKPHPSMIEAALRETGTAPHEAVMVGDTVYDIQMAKAAGVRAVGVSWGYHKPEDLLASGAELVLDHFDEFLQKVSLS